MEGPAGSVQRPRPPAASRSQIHSPPAGPSTPPAPPRTPGRHARPRPQSAALPLRRTRHHHQAPRFGVGSVQRLDARHRRLPPLPGAIQNPASGRALQHLRLPLLRLKPQSVPLPRPLTSTPTAAESFPEAPAPPTPASSPPATIRSQSSQRPVDTGFEVPLFRRPNNRSRTFVVPPPTEFPTPARFPGVVNRQAVDKKALRVSALL
jgi:hypothetical protein